MPDPKAICGEEKQETPEGHFQAMRRSTAHLWMELTREEQKALLLVLAVFLLGLTVRAYHGRHNADHAAGVSLSKPRSLPGVRSGI